MEEKTPEIRIVRKKVIHGGHHGGAWKVAYADFVTAMMAFFLVMWIVGLSQSVKLAISGYFKDPLGFMKDIKSGNAAFTVNTAVSNGKSNSNSSHPKDEFLSDRLRLRNAKTSIDKAIEATPELKKLKKHIDIKLVDEGLKIDLLEDKQNTFFDSGSAKIKPETAKLLSMIAKEIGKLPNKVVLEGHTDSRPLRRPHYTNWELSSDRANSARWVMEDSGLRKDQISQVRGFADRMLRDPAHPTSYANRRVSIIVVIKGGLGKQQFNVDQEIHKTLSDPNKPYHDNVYDTNI